MPHPLALGLALGALAGAGCVPYALPPSTGGVGVTQVSRAGGRPGIAAELGLAPLQLVPGQLHRAWDVAVVASYARADRDTWGAALMAGPVLHPWGDDPEAGTTRRLVPQLVGRLTTDGAGAGVRLGIERATFVRRRGVGSNAVGAGYGEAAIGGYAEIGATRADDRTTWTATVGLTVRIPAIAAIVCCAGL